MHRRALPAAVLSILLAVALSACGGEGGGGGTGGKAKAGGGGKAFPVTVTHRFGTTTIAKRPTRVVTVGRTDQDTAVVLDVLPVGVRQWFGGYPSAAWPWAQPELAEAQPAIVGDATTIDMARVKSLQPDVILAMDPDVTAAQYAELSRIAPVVGDPLPSPPGTPAWGPRTRLAGKALGRSAEAGAAVFAAKHDFIVVRDKHPGFAGKRMVVASRNEAGAITIYGPGDPRTRFLTDMGFRTPDWVVEEAGDRDSFTLAPGAASSVTGRRIVWLATPAQERAIRADPIVAAMPVTRTGRTTFLPQDGPPIGAALQFDTILSVRYAVDWAVPLLGPLPTATG